MLVEAGHAVTLLDKGRKPGGRCASRRAGAFAFDHGAQYFTVSDASFRRIVAAAEAAGAADRWVDPPFPSGGGAGGTSGHGQVDGRERWVGVPAMSAFAGHLAQALDIRAQARIERVEHHDGLWQLTAADRSVAGPFDTAIVAVPAPQAVALLAAAPNLAQRAGQAVLAPCWALMAGFADSPDPTPMAAAVEHGPLAWICNDSRKPGRAVEARGDAWVAHASPSWSRRHLEDEPASVATALFRAFADAAGHALPAPAYLAAHRWRFARVETPLAEPCLYDPKVGLGACGDWCLGPRIEAAYRSGLAMAERVLAHS